MYANRLIPCLAATLMLSCVGLVVVASAHAVSKPPPKFWSAARCEGAVLRAFVIRGQPIRFSLPSGDGHHFGVAQRICVGSGGAQACRWTAGHRARLYSQFRVFARSPLNGGVVRSWTLATRAGHGFAPIAHRNGDQYVGWPPDFYMSKVELLATNATAARFRSLIAPIAARLMQEAKATNCTGR